MRPAPRNSFNQAIAWGSNSGQTVKQTIEGHFGSVDFPSMPRHFNNEISNGGAAYFNATINSETNLINRLYPITIFLQLLQKLREPGFNYGGK